jgi:GDP-mannose 6-dehydrogenase
MKVAVIGLGYVGSVTAACLAVNGHDVWGVDVDSVKVDAIRAGHSPVAEPGLDEIVARAISSGSLHAATTYADALENAQVSLLCVGTPSASRGATDLTYVRRAVADIVAGFRNAGGSAARRHCIVVRSTVPPGTVDQVIIPALTDGLSGLPVTVGAGMCPEFLREGTGIADFYGSPLLVIGTNESWVADTVTSLFSFLDQPVRVVSANVAESLKYACNAFHATKVSFANEMGRLFGSMGVDAREVMSLFCEDRTLNISPLYLQPGFAFGGSCLPKDLRSLLHLGRLSGVDLPQLAGTLATNELVIRSVIDRVVASDGRSVALLGLSFKSDTDDLRESPNVELAERLIGKGFRLRIYDPVVNPDMLIGVNRRYVESRLPHLGRLLSRQPDEALKGAEVAIVFCGDTTVTAALMANRPRTLIDLNGRLGNDIEILPGYEGLGWLSAGAAQVS